jgi:hypothetical protein
VDVPAAPPQQRKKNKRRKTADDDDRWSRLIGGAFCMLLGVGMCAVAAYMMHDEQVRLRSKGRLMIAGLCTIALSLKLMVGWHKKEN